jgi:hypothetical protein
MEEKIRLILAGVYSLSWQAAEAFAVRKGINMAVQ